MGPQDSAAAAAATAMAAMAAGGIAPTDPRIQPFIRAAREEYMDLRIRVLISNGMSKETAREEVERSMPTDRFYFFGQALLKYLSSLTGDQSIASFASADLRVPQIQNAAYNVVPSVVKGYTYSAVHPSVSGFLTPMASVSTPQPQVQEPPYTAVVSNHNASGYAADPQSNSSVKEKELNLSSLQRLVEGFSPAATRVSVNTAASQSAAANILATAQSNGLKAKASRFDVPSDVARCQIDKTSGFASGSADQPSLSGTTYNARQQQLEKALQQWTYCVFSAHQMPPPGINGKTWRSALFQFVNQCVNSAQQTLTQNSGVASSLGGSSCMDFSASAPDALMPSWLASCQIPTTSHILYPYSFISEQSKMESSEIPNKKFSFIPFAANGAPLPSCPAPSNGAIPPPPPLSAADDHKTESTKKGDSHFSQVGNLSPVSSSEMSSASTSDNESERQNKRKPFSKSDSRLIPRQRSTSRCSSSMSDSSSSSEDARLSLGCSSNLSSGNVVWHKKWTKKKARFVSVRQSGTESAMNNVQHATKSHNMVWSFSNQLDQQQFGKVLVSKKLTNALSIKEEKLTVPLSAEERRRREDRSQRFSRTVMGSFGVNDEEHDGNSFHRSEVTGSSLISSEGLRMMTWQEKLAMLTNVERVVGLSQMLEKPYLRLCGPPDPALVRPEKVLVESFYHCLNKWNRDRNYRFIEEQFRSIRQDLTVQGIKNAFTVLVYETNARIALENLDLGQFNQCQTQIRELHKSSNVPLKNREEFLCYRILYLTLTNMRHDLLKLSGELSVEEKELSAVKFADRCRRAVIESNYHRLFFLVATGPYLTSKLVSIFLNKLRMTYLVLIARSHYVIPLSFLQRELMFAAFYDCQRFLKEQKAVWVPGRMDAIDGRKSAPYFEASPLLQSKKMKALG